MNKQTKLLCDYLANKIKARHGQYMPDFGAVVFHLRRIPKSNTYYIYAILTHSYNNAWRVGNPFRLLHLQCDEDKDPNDVLLEELSIEEYEWYDENTQLGAYLRDSVKLEYL